MSFFVSTKRILKYGFISFLRNGFVSFATILIMVISLFAIAGMMFSGAAMDAVLGQLENKVDINAYFVTDAEEDDILAVRDALKALPDVAEVTYISREEALKRFKEKNKDSQSTLQALEVLDENPLGASLAIRAKDPTKYKNIATFLENKTVVEKGQKTIIEKVNYFENQKAIERLTNITTSVRNLGFFLTLILIFATVVIVFNTIRLAIYTAREEIAVMQLVGASPEFIGKPYLVRGFSHGMLSGIFSVIILGLVVWLSWKNLPELKSLVNFQGLSFVFISTIILGILLYLISTYVVLRKFLKLRTEELY